MRNMDEWDCDPGEDLAAQVDDDEVPEDEQQKYRVKIELVIKSFSTDEAMEEAKIIIDKGILALVDEEDREPVHEYDVTEAELEEIS